MIKINHYVAWLPEREGTMTAKYQGFAENKEEFIAMCEDVGFDLDGLTITEEHRNCKDAIGRPSKKRVEEDYT